MLRAQRGGRRGGRRCADRARVSRSSGARAMDARAGAQLGTATARRCWRASTAALDGSGTIVDWDYQVWSNTHSTRPGGRGNLLPAWRSCRRSADRAQGRFRCPRAAATATPFHSIGSRAHGSSPFHARDAGRVSALRGLGAYMNIFSIESFMDELGSPPASILSRSAFAPRRSAGAGRDPRAAHGSAGLRYARPGWGGASPSPATRISGPMSRSRSKSTVDRETGSVSVIAP